MRTVIIGPTGPNLRTVNVSTGPSGATGTWETVNYVGSGPAGLFETVKVANARDNRFRSLAVSGFTGTVTPDAGGVLPDPPTGFAYLVNAGGKYIVNADSAYILAKI
jgi:hypothetical protein